MMTVGLDDLLGLLRDLTVRERRLGAAQDLARRLGALDLVLFVPDPETGTLLPAAGFKQTLPGSHEWRPFLERCREHGIWSAALPWLAQPPLPATGLALGDAVVVIIGETIGDGAADLLRGLLPPIAAAAAAEQRADIARAREKVALRAAAEAEALSTELDHARGELERLYAELREASRARDEFFSMAAHELKTPLTTVKGFVQLLARRIYRGQPELREELGPMVRRLEEQIARLEELTTHLLDVSRLDRPDLALTYEPVELGELALEIIERFQPRGASPGAQSLILEAGDEVTGLWDRRRLDDVLTNLVSNAVKYSPDGGTVRLRISSSGGWAQVSVADEGIGISEEEQARLFQPFYRAGSAAGIVGSGLGLYIAHRAVQQQGGAIAVESKPGRGSTFTVRLPLARAGATGPGGDGHHGDKG